VARDIAPEIHWHESSAEQTALLDRSFDAVLCSLGFMFFADKLRALREMRRVLEGEVAVRCQSFVDGDVTVMEPDLLVATGRATGQGR